MRLFDRAARRAGLPVTVDASPFHARPLMYTALVLSLGATSQHEMLELYLTRRMEAGEAMEKLQVGSMCEGGGGEGGGGPRRICLAWSVEPGEVMEKLQVGEVMEKLQMGEVMEKLQVGGVWRRELERGGERVDPRLQPGEAIEKLQAGARGRRRDGHV
jgi:hypothetical protein